MAVIFFREKRLSEALKIAEKSLPVAAGKNLLGVIHAEMKIFETAEKYLLEASKEDPKSFISFFNKAKLLKNLRPQGKRLNKNFSKIDRYFRSSLCG